MNIFDAWFNPSGEPPTDEPSQYEVKVTHRNRTKMDIDTKLKQFASFLKIDTNNKTSEDIFKQIVGELERKGLSGEQESKLDKLKGISDNVLTMEEHLEEFNKKVQELGEFLVYIGLKELALHYGIVDTTKKQPKEIFTQIMRKFPEPTQQTQKTKWEDLKGLLAQQSRSLTYDDVRTLEELRRTGFQAKKSVFQKSPAAMKRTAAEDTTRRNAARVKAQEEDRAAQAAAQAARREEGRAAQEARKAEQAQKAAQEARKVAQEAQKAEQARNMIRLMLLLI